MECRDWTMVACEACVKPGVELRVRRRLTCSRRPSSPSASARRRARRPRRPQALPPPQPAARGDAWRRSSPARSCWCPYTNPTLPSRAGGGARRVAPPGRDRQRQACGLGQPGHQRRQPRASQPKRRHQLGLSSAQRSSGLRSSAHVFVPQPMWAHVLRAHAGVTHAQFTTASQPDRQYRRGLRPFAHQHRM